jgi:ABC-type amino acid transport substrate-binding protein
MSIKPIKELEKDKIEIDLTGPNGNAFYLLGMARKLGRQLEWNKEKIQATLDEMKSSDYNNLIEIFDREFGDYVDLYR